MQFEYFRIFIYALKKIRKILNILNDKFIVPKLKAKHEGDNDSITLYMASVGIESKIILSYAINRMCEGVSPNDKQNKCDHLERNLFQNYHQHVSHQMCKCNHCQTDCNSMYCLLFIVYFWVIAFQNPNTHYH